MSKNKLNPDLEDMESHSVRMMMRKRKRFHPKKPLLIHFLSYKINTKVTNLIDKFVDFFAFCVLVSVNDIMSFCSLVNNDCPNEIFEVLCMLNLIVKQSPGRSDIDGVQDEIYRIHSDLHNNNVSRSNSFHDDNLHQCNNDTEYESNSDGSDSNNNIDSDSNNNIDSDSNNNIDSDSNNNIDSDSNNNIDSDSDSNIDSDSDSDSDSDDDTDSDSSSSSSSSDETNEDNRKISPKNNSKNDTIIIKTGLPNLNSKCYECGKNVDNFKKHYKGRERPNFKLKCDLCKFYSSTKCSLKAHSRIHHNEPPFICPDCGIVFLTTSELDLHMKRDCFYLHKIYKFKCSLCLDVDVDSLFSFHKHLRERHYVKLFKCSSCNLGYRTLKAVKRHLKESHSVYTFLNVFHCDLCPYTLYVNSYALEHICIHTLKDTAIHYAYLCVLCKSFTADTLENYRLHRERCYVDRSSSTFCNDFPGSYNNNNSNNNNNNNNNERQDCPLNGGKSQCNENCYIPLSSLLSRTPFSNVQNTTTVTTERVEEPIINNIDEDKDNYDKEKKLLKMNKDVIDVEKKELFKRNNDEKNADDGGDKKKKLLNTKDDHKEKVLLKMNNDYRDANDDNDKNETHLKMNKDEDVVDDKNKLLLKRNKQADNDDDKNSIGLNMDDDNNNNKKQLHMDEEDNYNNDKKKRRLKMKENEEDNDDKNKKRFSIKTDKSDDSFDDNEKRRKSLKMSNYEDNNNNEKRRKETLQINDGEDNNNRDRKRKTLAIVHDEEDDNEIQPLLKIKISEDNYNNSHQLVFKCLECSSFSEYLITPPKKSNRCIKCGSYKMSLIEKHHCGSLFENIHKFL